MRTGVRALIYALFLLSGCTGLVYEVVWSRELIFVLGGTTYAITTVLVAFMSGLGIGSYTAGRICDRLHQPGRIYGYLEIVIGLYALAIPLLLSLVEPLYRLLYPSVADMPGLLTAARFLVSAFVLLLPATCMGATLPILVRYITREGLPFGRSVSLLYGINTFGAMLGTVAAGFWLIPVFGLTKATLVAASANLLIGITAIIVFRSSAELGVGESAQQKKPSPPETKTHKKKHAKNTVSGLLVISDRLRLAVLIAFGLSGFAAMVYQIAWTRALVMCVGSSTYAFTCILSAFIFGLAIGSLAIAHWVDRLRQPVLIVGVLQLAIAMSAIVIVPIHSHIPILIKNLVVQHKENFGILLAYQFALIIAITIVPTFLMGAIFPLVTRIIAIKDGATGAAVGRAYAVNTIGTVTGSFLAGFVMIRSEVLGVQNSIVTAALLNALIGAWLVLHSRPPGVSATRRAMAVVPAVLYVPIIALAAGRWNRELLTSGPYLGFDRQQDNRKVIFYSEGVDLTVSVTRLTDRPDALSMEVNGKVDASLQPSDMPTQLLLGHLPSLLTNDGKRACVIGLGSGITLGAVARHPSYKQIDCVEISDDVIEAAKWFSPYHYNVLKDDPRIRMIRGDGRNHLLLTDQMYDMIVSEPSNPWIAGVANLFTKEFFSLCEQRLNQEGRLCVWLHGYSISVDDFKMVIHTLSDVFPSVTIWQSIWDDYLLIAGRTPFAIRLDDLLRRFNEPSVRADLYRAGLSNLSQILGTFITSGDPLRTWAESSAINNDDNALLEFSAPFNLYRASQNLIAGIVYELRRSPFEEVLIADPQNPKHKAIQGHVAEIIQARVDFQIGLQYQKAGEHAKYSEYLLKAIRQNPCDQAIRYCVRDLRQFAENPQNRATVPPSKWFDQHILDQLYDLPPVPSALATGADLTDLAQAIESLALQCLGKDKPNWAHDLLQEAQEIDPQNADVLKPLIAVLAQGSRMPEFIQQLDQLLAQQPDQGRLNYLRGICAVQQGEIESALDPLEKALKSRTISPNQMAGSPGLQPIAGNLLFHALLARYSSPTRAP